MDNYMAVLAYISIGLKINPEVAVTPPSGLHQQNRAIVVLHNQWGNQASCDPDQSGLDQNLGFRSSKFKLREAVSPYISE